MQGWESSHIGIAISVVFFPLTLYRKTTEGVEKLPGVINRSNNRIYDFLTPNALQRRLTKYNTLLALNNDSYLAFKRGVVYFILGKYTEALSDFNNSLKWSETANHEPYCFLGMIMTRLARYPEAVEAYTTALEYFQEKMEQSATEKLSDHFRQNKRQVSRFTHGITTSLITKLKIKDSANVIEKQKQREQIEDMTDNMFATRLDANDILNNRGLVHMNLGNWQEAKKDLQTAGDGRSHYVFNLATVCYFDDETQTALNHFNHAIELAKDDVPAQYYVMLACAQEKLNNAKGAAESRTKAQERNPKVQLYPFHYKFLSNDTFMHILSFLPHNTLSQVAQTCRTMYNICQHSSFYTYIDMMCIYDESYDQTGFSIPYQYSERCQQYLDYVLARSKSNISSAKLYARVSVDKLKDQTFKKLYIYNDGCSSELIVPDVFFKNNMFELEEYSIAKLNYYCPEHLLDPSKLTKLKSLSLNTIYYLEKKHLEPVLKVTGATLEHFRIIITIRKYDTPTHPISINEMEQLVAQYCPQLVVKNQTAFEREYVIQK
jgi:tetratricopeptide (TPR) repeat protein